MSPPAPIAMPAAPRTALVAGPLSPRVAPPPAIVAITPPETLRIRRESAMKRSPGESSINFQGKPNSALVAGPASPLNPSVPFPATVVMIPSETLRTRRLPVSAMNKLPAESTATPQGLLNSALVAGPPSPVKPDVPFPATVLITPFETLRMRLLKVSATYRLPIESTAILHAYPLPATVVITPFDTLRTRLFPSSAMKRLPAESKATSDGPPNWALVAKPLSPLKPNVPFPATVVITPFDTLRTRLLYWSAIYGLQIGRASCRGR